MHTKFAIGAMTFALALATSASATSYSFNVSSGSWKTSTNWAPNGVPGAGDIVTINSSQTCTSGGNIAALRVTVATGGTLVVETGDDLAVSSKINLDGDINFESGASLTVSGSSFSIAGSGALNASAGSSLGPATIDDGGSTILEVWSGIVLKGSFTILTDKLDLQGELRVDNASDTMYLGGTTGDYLEMVTGKTGTITVSDGEFRVRRVQWSGVVGFVGATGSFDVSGGTLRFTNDAQTLFLPILYDLDLTGGVLINEKDFLWFISELYQTGGAEIRCLAGKRLDVDAP